MKRLILSKWFTICGTDLRAMEAIRMVSISESFLKLDT